MTLASEQYKLPRELERRPPRRVQRKGSVGCGIVFGRLFILPHVIVGIVMIFLVPLKIALVTVGETYQGEMGATSTSRGSKGRTNYHLEYSYEAGGETHKGKRSISKAEYERLSQRMDTQPPAPLEVRAMSTAGYRFDETFLPGESLATPVLFVLMFAMFWNAILSIFVYLLWIGPWLEKRLYQNGKPVAGRVVKMHSKQSKSTTYYLDYQFDHPGLGVRTATMTVPYDRWQLAREGEAVTVLCYTHRKRITLIYEYGDFVCI